MKKVFILFLFFFLFGKNIDAQLGCTDPQATNYDMNATTNDGSCIYPTTNYSLNEITVLPPFINENSGLAFFDNQLWTHNDGGGEDKLYQIDTMTGDLLETVIVAAAENEDWEDLAEDEEHIYIGDFGNNDGDRTDLRIYKVKKSQFASGVATAETIEFSYSDQTDFTTANHANDYDCEAFFYLNDSLHLFSKNWVNQKTRHYVLPATPGTHTAELRDSLNVQGLITGADISDEGVVALLGYSLSGVNVMWLCFDYQGTNFFSGNKRKISLGLALTNSQTEAIVFRGNGAGFISAEAFANLNAKLHQFNSNQWTTNNTVSNEEISNENQIHVFPNPTSGVVNIDFENVLLNESFEIKLFNAQGQFLQKRNQQNGGVLTWNLEHLPKGIYFLQTKNDNGTNISIQRITIQ